MADRIVSLVLRYLPTFLVIAATVHVLVGEKILMQETLVIALVATIGIDLMKLLFVEGMTSCNKCTDPRGCLDLQGNNIAKGECKNLVGSAGAPPTDPRPADVIALENKKNNEWYPAVTRMKELLKKTSPASKAELEAQGDILYTTLGEIKNMYGRIGNDKYCASLLPNDQTVVCDTEKRVIGDYSRIPYGNRPHDPKSKADCKSFYSDKGCPTQVQGPATYQTMIPDIK